MKKERNKKYSTSDIMAGILTAAFILCLACACVNNTTWQKSEGMIWHTSWHATYLGTADMMNGVIDSLKAVEHSLSVFDPTSLVSAINRQTSGKTDFHFATVYTMSRKMNRLSDGMFDPTLAAVIDAWGFGKSHIATPDTARIEEMLAATGIDKTRIENGILYKDNPGISFNFSAVAKGYGVDMAAKALEQQGCSNLMMEIGGEIVCRGTNPEGKKWRIMIETPDEEYLREVFGNHTKPSFPESLIVEMTDEALATSGNYRNFRKDSHQTYGHTISPKTGRPIATDILSASVIAPTCAEADAAATACMAMGSMAGMAMLDKENLAGAFILCTGEVVVNNRMKEHIAE